MALFLLVGLGIPEAAGILVEVVDLVVARVSGIISDM